MKIREFDYRFGNAPRHVRLMEDVLNRLIDQEGDGMSLKVGVKLPSSDKESID